MKFEVKHVNELKKKNKDAIFLGCGKSINSLTDSHIDFMKNNLDIWTSNSFMINKDIIPDFYHLEVKHHRNGPVVKRTCKEKCEKYKNVKWIIDATRPYLLDYIGVQNYPQENFFGYTKIYRRENDGKYKPDPMSLSVSLNASLSLICDLIIKMKYDKVYFLGVDMYDSEYFWTHSKKYEDVLIEDIIRTNKPDERKPTDMHPTYKMKDFIKEIFEFNNSKAINLSEKSLLSSTIETRNISEEFINEI